MYCRRAGLERYCRRAGLEKWQEEGKVNYRTAREELDVAGMEHPRLEKGIGSIFNNKNKTTKPIKKNLKKMD